MKNARIAALASASLFATAAQASPLFVPLGGTDNHSQTLLDPSQSFTGKWEASEETGCTFAPFDYDPTVNDGISFRISPPKRSDFVAGSRLRVDVVATLENEPCQGGQSLQIRLDQQAMRLSNSAASDDRFVAVEGVQPFVGGAMDAAEADPLGHHIGFAGNTQSYDALAPWAIDFAELGIPSGHQPAGKYRVCSCQLRVAGEFDHRPDRLVWEPQLLVDVQPAQPAQCPAGGAVIYKGFDDGLAAGVPNDGVLQTEEIDQALIVCNGAAGADGSSGPSGLASLVATTPEAAGTNCASGGTRIDTGIDDDGNGQLAATEIDSTAYVCNGVAGEAGVAGAVGGAGPAGADGKTSLVNVVAEPAGANCTDGGSQIQTGLDTDGDGKLSAAEVTGTSFVCSQSVTKSIGCSALPVESLGALTALAMLLRRRSRR